MHQNDLSTNSPAVPASGPAIERLVYNAKEACVALNVSQVTLGRLEKRGLLRRVQGIRHLMFSVEELKRFLKAQTAGA
jgi:hypothetical protein